MTISVVMAVVPVSDMGTAERWYTQFFGRTADAQPMDSLTEWRFDQAVVQVFQDPERAGRAAVNFVVDNLDELRSALAGQGVPTDDPQIVAGGYQRLCVVADPDGNQLGLLEPVGRE